MTLFKRKEKVLDYQQVMQLRSVNLRKEAQLAARQLLDQMVRDSWVHYRGELPLVEKVASLLTNQAGLPACHVRILTLPKITSLALLVAWPEPIGSSLVYSDSNGKVFNEPIDDPANIGLLFDRQLFPVWLRGQPPLKPKADE